jgi:hypothetical protein
MVPMAGVDGVSNTPSLTTRGISVLTEFLVTLSGGGGESLGELTTELGGSPFGRELSPAVVAAGPLAAWARGESVATHPLRPEDVDAAFSAGLRPQGPDATFALWATQQGQAGHEVGGDQGPHYGAGADAWDATFSDDGGEYFFFEGGNSD